MGQVSKWAVLEIELRSVQTHDNPFLDVDVRAAFTSPSGTVKAADAFWDGGNVWKIRFSPDEIGEWQWQTVCEGAADAGLHGQAGRFTCVPYTGSNPIYRHGPVRLSENQRHLVWADGASFFWLADTAWNGVLRAQEDDWHTYLQARRDQAFTAIQFVCTQWRGATAVLDGEFAFEGTEDIRLDPDFFRKRDAKVAAINRHGLVAAPVLLWALGESDPGQILAEADAIRLARYMVARWGAYHVVWLLGGDGHYEGELAGRWHRIGNAVFGGHRGCGARDRLVTMHPCGQSWVGETFRGQPWFDFIGYQSGHGSSDDHLRWLVQGPPSTEWANDPPLPVINLEPNYEMHPSYHIARTFGAYEVRRAAYWSLLVSPPAGVTYGNNPIWVWPPGETPELPEGHDRIGPVAPWQAGVDTPGIRAMTVMRSCFDRLPWWDLRPAPELLTEQPGDDDPAQFIAAAKTADGRLAVVYIPKGGAVCLDTSSLQHPAVQRWFNPRTGEWTASGPVAATTCTLTSPEDEDWVLCIQSV